MSLITTLTCPTGVPPERSLVALVQHGICLNAVTEVSRRAYATIETGCDDTGRLSGKRGREERRGEER